MYETQLEFPVGCGVGSKKKISSVGEVWIFSGIIHYIIKYQTRLIDDHYKFQGIIYMLQLCQTTVELWYNEGQCDWQSMFAITRFCCIKVLFSIVYCY